jgi:hypothetical protein
MKQMKSVRASKSGAYIEIIGGKMDMPPALAYAHECDRALLGTLAQLSGCWPNVCSIAAAP